MQLWAINTLTLAFSVTNDVALVRQERGWRLRALLAGIAEDPEIRQTCRVKQTPQQAGLHCGMDALLALPPTKLAGIIEGLTAIGSAAS